MEPLVGDRFKQVPPGLPLIAVKRDLQWSVAPNGQCIQGNHNPCGSVAVLAGIVYIGKGDSSPVLPPEIIVFFAGPVHLWPS